MSLVQLASDKGLFFGAAVWAKYLSDNAYFANMQSDCNVGFENDLKFVAVSPSNGNFNFGQGNLLKAWGTQRGKRFRGNTLIWERPDTIAGWFRGGSWTSAQAFAAMEAYITKTMEAFPCHSWDVINEVFANNAGDQPNAYGMSQMIYGSAPVTWLARCGPDYPEQAFKFAAAADPNAKLVINDFLMECTGWGGAYDTKFANCMKMVDRLQKKGIRVDAIGFQGHITPSWQLINNADPNIGGEIFDPTALKKKLAQLKSRGLKAHITELDVGANPLSFLPLYKAYVETFLEYEGTEVLQVWEAGGPMQYDGTTSLWGADYKPNAFYSALTDAFTKMAPRGTVTTPPPIDPNPGDPPVPATPSADGTKMLAVPTAASPATSVVDKNGRTWAYGGNAATGNRPLMRDGVEQTWTNATILAKLGGEIWQTNQAELQKLAAQQVWWRAKEGTSQQTDWDEITGQPAGLGTQPSDPPPPPGNWEAAKEVAIKQQISTVQAAFTALSAAEDSVVTARAALKAELTKLNALVS